MKVWLNGALLEAEEARVSVLDHGLLAGDGLFETLRCYAGRPFALREHLERLEAGAQVLAIAHPSAAELEEAVRELVSANALSDARVRITVTSGPGPAGLNRGDGPPTVLITAVALSPWPATASAVVSPWPRSERSALAGVKTTSNAENIIALAHARSRGASEALFLNLGGELCEGASSNLFVVRDGRVATPPLSAGCLAGITRARLLRLGRDVGIEVVEEDLPAAALEDADELFLTSSGRGVQPLTSVGGRPVGDGAPGTVSGRLAEAFSQMVRRELGLRG